MRGGVIRLALLPAFRGRRTIAILGAVSSALGLFPFGELLMRLRQEEEAVGGGVGGGLCVRGERSIVFPALLLRQGYMLTT